MFSTRTLHPWSKTLILLLGCFPMNIRSGQNRLEIKRLSQSNRCALLCTAAHCALFPQLRTAARYFALPCAHTLINKHALTQTLSQAQLSRAWERESYFWVRLKSHQRTWTKLLESSESCCDGRSLQLKVHPRCLTCTPTHTQMQRTHTHTDTHAHANTHTHALTLARHRVGRYVSSTFSFPLLLTESKTKSCRKEISFCEFYVFQCLQLFNF